MVETFDVLPVAEVDDWNERRQRATEALQHIIVDGPTHARSGRDLEMRSLWWFDFLSGSQARSHESEEYEHGRWTFPGEKRGETVLGGNSSAFAILGIGPHPESDFSGAIEVSPGAHGHQGRLAILDPASGYTVETTESDHTEFPETESPALLDTPILVKPSDNLHFRAATGETSQAVILGVAAGVLGESISVRPGDETHGIF